MNSAKYIRIALGIGLFGLASGTHLPTAQAQDGKATRLASLQSPGSNQSQRSKRESADRGSNSFAAYSPGTIVVRTRQRRLYYITADGRAVGYSVGVGRLDKQWFGRSMVSGKYIKPAWSPPEEVRRDNPRLPNVIPGGASNNPMGVAAMTLSGGEYAIHGTNRPASIGGFVSYGCFRMHNADILDLFRRVDVGTPVVVER